MRSFIGTPTPSGVWMALFVYTSSCWGVESSREGLPDSNLGSYQPAPTTSLSVSGPCARFGKKALQPISRTPSPPLLPTHRQPVLPYGGVIGEGRHRSKRQVARKGLLKPLQSSHSSPPGLSKDLLLSPVRARSPSPLEYVEDNEPMKEVEPDWN